MVVRLPFKLALHAYNRSPQVLEEKMAERSLSPDIWVEHADGSRYIPDATELMELGSVAHFVASEWKLPKGFSPDVARNCLVLGPSVLSNVFVNPKTMRVTAITDLETAIVAPFTLSLTYPEEISQSAGAPESWVQTSGDFAEVPYEGVPAPDSSQYNELVNKLSMRKWYKRCLAKHDKRFGRSELWTAWEDALKIHHLAVNGWTSWVRKRRWLALQMLDKMRKRA